MEYLHQLELFVMKKLLLEAENKPKEYPLISFSKYGSKVIIDCLLRLAKEHYLTLSNIKIGREFLGTIFSDFIGVDFNERGRPAYAGVNYKEIKDCDYAGLGKKTFKRYEEECCFESSILEPDFDLEVNVEELKYIIKRSSYFPSSYGNSLFENLTFYICQNKKQKKKLEKYLNEYLGKFRNDDLERQSATDYYKYDKQKEILNRTIANFGIDYPIKNLWLKESDFGKHFNFLEALLCLEQEGGKEKSMKIEKLDREKGVRITDYSPVKSQVSRIAKEIKEETEEPSVQTEKNGDPYTKIENGKGYFKFYKQGENIEIGKPSSRHFRLLQCLCNPHFGVRKTTEAVFESIKKPKDKNDSSLDYSSPERRTRMLTIIEYAKKELQKNKKLQKKLKYKQDGRKQSMWLELEG